ncbi:MAG: CPBP family intramembrane metalloprotease [Chloroflexota bacterium]|nr:MAG: CPBP family intramembrane metalloprotease [Chloroflexota bacterium]
MESPTSPPRHWLQKIFISPHESRLRAGWRLAGQSLLLIFALSLFSSLGNGVLSTRSDISYAGLLLFSTMISSLAVTASIFIARRLLDQRSFVSLGLEIKSQSVKDILFGVLLSGLMVGVIYLLFWAFGWLEVESLAWHVEGWGSLLSSVLVMISFFVLVAWQEELLLRGYWLQNLSDGLSRSLGVLLSSALFAFAHVVNPNLSWEAYLGIFLSGLFLAYGYLRTNQLWLPIGLHIGWNLFEGTVFGFPVSGQYYYQLVRQTLSGPEIITGGAFGPEAGFILLPVLLLGVAGIFWYTRNRSPVQGAN